MEKIKLVLSKLFSSLDALNFETDITLQQLNVNLAVISSAVEELRAIIEVSQLSVEEEVEFFKTVKPKVLSYQLYYFTLFKLESERPAGDPQMAREYYREKLIQATAYFSEHRFYYDYYRFGSRDLDQYLFIRGASLTLIPIAELCPPDKSFSTLLDYTFARFMSIELLTDYISAKLGYSGNARLSNADGSQRNNRGRLKWTGETVNLVEIAYGIWLTGQVNNGNATITDIFYWLEDNLQISIGRPHRRWIDLSKRKRISPANFINQMETAINKRIDNEIAR